MKTHIEKTNEQRSCDHILRVKVSLAWRVGFDGWLEGGGTVIECKACPLCGAKRMAK
jgi:hypothetical protein